jgi:Flp pilus assembly pilin Flp
MFDLLNRGWVRLSTALMREDGQAVTEYAVVLVIVALIAAALAAPGVDIGGTIVGKITAQLSKI